MDQEGEARATSSRVDDLEINELRILLDSFGEVTQRAVRILLKSSIQVILQSMRRYLG